MSRDEAYRYGGAAVIIGLILLLFLGKGKAPVIVQEGDVSLNVSSPVTEYNVPPLDLARLPNYSAPFDWQTTDAGCMCNVGYRQAIYIPPPPPVRRATPAFVFVAPIVIPPAPPLQVPQSIPSPVITFPSYVPPTFTYRKRQNGIFFMTYTDGTGRVNQGGSLPLFVIETSDGEILNAYNRRFVSGRGGSIIFGATTYLPATDNDRI